MNYWAIASWVSVATCLTAYTFNIKKNKVCFILWDIGAILFILVNLFWTHDYAQMGLNIAYFFINGYGWFKWRKDEQIAKAKERDGELPLCKF